MGPKGLLLGLPILLTTFVVDASDYQIVTEEWAPYNYLEGGQIRGISADVVKAIQLIAHTNFETQILPSMRSTWTLDNEPRTILFSLFRTKEREKKYKWVGPILEESIFPYRLRSPLPLETSLDDLKAREAITTRHAGLVPSVLQALGFTNLDKSATESTHLYKMLFTQRAEVIVGDTDLGVRFYLKKLGFSYEALERIPVEILRSELFIAFSPDSDDTVVESWRQALTLLKANGEYRKIVARYE